jgi:hypothetical protein
MLELLRKEEQAHCWAGYVLYGFLLLTGPDIYMAEFSDDNLYSGHVDNICLQRAKFNRKLNRPAYITR